jgi:hypothetical protein
LVFEYWVTAERAQRAGHTLAHEQTRVVREQLVRARKVRGVDGALAQCGYGEYVLAPKAVVVPGPPAPAEAVLRSEATVGMGVLAVFKYGEAGQERLRWYEGVITSAPASAARKSASRRSAAHRVYWMEDGTNRKLQLGRSKYSVAPASGEGAWFLFGSREQVVRLAQQAAVQE